MADKVPAKLFIIEKEDDVDQVIAKGPDWPHLDIKLDKQIAQSSFKNVKIESFNIDFSNPKSKPLTKVSEFMVVKKFQDSTSGMWFIYGYPLTKELREG